MPPTLEPTVAGRCAFLQAFADAHHDGCHEWRDLHIALARGIRSIASALTGADPSRNERTPVPSRTSAPRADGERRRLRGVQLFNGRGTSAFSGVPVLRYSGTDLVDRRRRQGCGRVASRGQLLATVTVVGSAAPREERLAGGGRCARRALRAGADGPSRFRPGECSAHDLPCRGRRQPARRDAADPIAVAQVAEQPTERMTAIELIAGT